MEKQIIIYKIDSMGAVEKWKSLLQNIADIFKLVI